MCVRIVLVPPGKLCSVKGQSEYHQGDCDVLWEGLTTTRVTVLSTGIV